MSTNVPRVAGIVLAAGAGRRYGKPKALVELHGRLLVDRAADVLRAGGCDPVVVVLGASADEVRARAGLDDVVVTDNADWPTGMASSLRAGLTALAETARTENGVAATVILPVDVPGVTSAAVRRVIAAAPEPMAQALAAASYDGVRGHPVLLGSAHWAGIVATATGDSGARDYLRTHDVRSVPCADIAVGTDVDRPEDLPS